MTDDRDPALASFEMLIGTWKTEAFHPLFEHGDIAVHGEITFEWLEGGKFLIQRSRNEHELFPDAICVTGAPETGEGLVMEYFDSRGVKRTYGVAVEDGVLRMWREDPAFAQRFEAELVPGTFTGQWQVATEPGVYEDDLRMTYTRVS